MPSSIALFLCILFILYLFKKDGESSSHVSGSLWLPLIWLLILGSRPVALWLNIGPVLETDIDIIQGNPVDRTIFIILMFFGILVLSRRKENAIRLLKGNAWFIMLLVYGGVSIVWSDYPFVSFKRWIREFGNLIMVMIILTEAESGVAARTVIRRTSYILIPFSILLIKYFPYLGMEYGPWSGELEYLGVATSKNMLGNLCLVSGLFFLGDFLKLWGGAPHLNNKINVLFLAMISWLLIKSHSATSSICLIVGSFTLVGLGLPIIKRNVKFIGFYFFLAVVFIMILQWVFNIDQSIIASAGRDMTLTGRTELWKEVTGLVTNPYIGTGYDSFWLGERMTKLWTDMWWHPTQAHNGYIETYLNLGLIGLLLLSGFVFSAYKKIRRTLASNFDYGRLQMAVWIVTLLVNISEGVFKGTSIMWFTFLMIALDVLRPPNAEFRLAT